MSDFENDILELPHDEQAPIIFYFNAARGTFEYRYGQHCRSRYGRTLNYNGSCVVVLNGYPKLLFEETSVGKHAEGMQFLTINWQAYHAVRAAESAVQKEQA